MGSGQNGPGLALLLLAVVAGGCQAAALSSPGPCVPLAAVSANCPADWAAAMADRNAFCAKTSPGFDVFLSTAVCRGALHYTRYLFDGGPRRCLYDGATGQLTGYGASDPKVMFSSRSCGPDPNDFDDRGCPGLTCAPSPPDDGGRE